MVDFADKIFTVTRLHLFIIAVLFLVTRVFFLLTPAGQLGDADQAVFGMMAQKIAALEEFPIYCWEAHYGGAPVSYISALFFHFWGSGFVQIRLAMMLIVFPAYFLFYFIYKRLFGDRAALIGVLFLLFAPYLVLNCTTAAYGGYGESFLGIALLVLLSWKIDDRDTRFPLRFTCFLLGLICGFFVYIHFYVVPAILAFAVPVLWRHGMRQFRMIGSFFIGGGLIGILPLLVYNIANQGGTFTRGAAWALLIGREEASMPAMEVLEKIVLHKSAYLWEWIFNAPLMFGQFFIPPVFGYSIQAVAGFMLMAVFTAYTIYAFKGIGTGVSHIFYHRQFASYLLMFILFQWMASLHADRHFLPLIVVIPVALMGMANLYPCLKKGMPVFLMLVCIFQMVGWHQEFKAPRFDPGPVIQAMNKEGIKKFYASYWTAYPVMFLGNGTVIGSPLLLPNHEPFSDRRPQYTEHVIRSREAAFVFGAGEENLKNEFLSFLKVNQITCRSHEMSQVHLYYSLSKPVSVHFHRQSWKNYFFLK